MATVAPEFQFEVQRPAANGARPIRPITTAQERTHELHEVALPELGRFEAAERYGEPRVIASVDTTAGVSELELPLRVRQLADGRTEAAGRSYRLWLRTVIGDQDGRLDWRLDPGGEDAVGRARLIDFLLALSGNGLLVLRDPDAGAIAAVRLAGSPTDTELVQERAFLKDVVAVELWSGMRVPVPDEPNDDELTVLAELVAWIHEPRRPARFVGPITGLVTSPPEGADHLVLYEPWRPTLFGMDLRMGRFKYDVDVRYEAAEKQDDGRYRAVFAPLDKNAEAQLEPPTPRNAASAMSALRGELPERPREASGPRREKIRKRARDLAKSWHLEEEEDDETRDHIRRQWPT